MYALQMPYPERLLSPGETIVKEFRPHWQALLVPILLGLVAAALIAGAFVVLEPGTQEWVALAIGLIWLVTAARRLLTWLTTHYVITNERVIYRSGVLARRGKEIPLEVVNDVAFNQSVFERLIRSGDLLIESAGEYGQSHYTDVPEPEAMQSLIYQLREERTIGLRRGGTSTASELEALARLKDQGVLTVAEFEAQKRRLLDS